MTTEIELVDTPTLAEIASDTGIDLATTGLSLLLTLRPLAEQAADIMRQAEGLTVTSIEQKDEMRKSRELRLALRKVRVEVEGARKSLKEESLRRGQFIDGISKIVREKCEATEARLEDQEKFAERQEAARKAKITAERVSILAAYEINTAFMDLANMPAEDFDRLVAQSRDAHQNKLEREKREAEERAAREEAARVEAERIRAENARLRAEAAERERLATIEREKAAKAQREAEAEAARAREAQAKAEAKLRAEREAKERAERDEANARRRAERAPDRDKLIALSQAVAALSIPTLTTADGKKVQRVVENTIKSCSGAILELAKELD